MAVRYIVGRALSDGFKVRGIALTKLEALDMARALVDELGIGAKFKSRLAAVATEKAAAIDALSGVSVRLSHVWEGPQIIAFDDGK